MHMQDHVVSMNLKLMPCKHAKIPQVRRDAQTLHIPVSAFVIGVFLDLLRREHICVLLFVFVIRSYCVKLIGELDLLSSNNYCTQAAADNRQTVFPPHLRSVIAAHKICRRAQVPN